MSIPLEPGGIYHIYNRGNNRENIFIEARNYRYFLQLYGRYITPVAETLAYCLMKNHFHFAIRIKQDLQGFRNLEGLPSGRKMSQPFSNFFNAYTKAFNKTYERSGALFEGRFKRKAVDDERYLTHLIAYIHRNPQQHGFVDDYRDWPYSSYGALISSQPTQLARSEALRWFGDPAQFIQFHQDVADWKEIATLIEDDFD